MTDYMVNVRSERRRRLVDLTGQNGYVQLSSPKMEWQKACILSSTSHVAEGDLSSVNLYEK